MNDALNAFNCIAHDDIQDELLGCVDVHSYRDKTCTSHTAGLLFGMVAKTVTPSEISRSEVMKKMFAWRRQNWTTLESSIGRTSKSTATR